MRKPSFVSLFLIAFFLSAFCTSAPMADEIELRSKGGAYQGKYKYGEIAKEDALIEIRGGMPEPNKIFAGYGNNQVYIEIQNFSDGQFRFEKIEFPYFWRETNFDVDAALHAIFPEANGFVDRQGEKRGRRLITAYGVRGQANCAGLIYAGSDHDSQNEPNLFNDWYGTSVVCDQFRRKEELLAAAASRLAESYRGGRRLVDLSSYDLPTDQGTVSGGDRRSESRTQSAASPVRSENSLPVAFNWSGVTNLGVGSLSVSLQGSDGELTADLGTAIGKCVGKWERKGGHQKTVEGSYGVWYMTCGNGLSSSPCANCRQRAPPSSISATRVTRFARSPR